jgi:hypothetical protein
LSFVLDEGGAEERCVAVDVRVLAAAPPHASPNLPILTREDEAACVLRNRHGSPAVMVPHAAITALAAQSPPTLDDRCWSYEPAAIDLWLPLMAGSPAILAAA